MAVCTFLDSTIFSRWWRSFNYSTAPHRSKTTLISNGVFCLLESKILSIGQTLLYSLGKIRVFSEAQFGFNSLFCWQIAGAMHIKVHMGVTGSLAGCDWAFIRSHKKCFLQWLDFSIAKNAPRFSGDIIECCPI
jgi:hypothetical protein